MAKEKKKGVAKRFSRAAYAALGAFAAGFFPSYWSGKPVLSILIAACAAMPIGSLSASVVGGLVRGLGIGVVFTAGIIGGLAMAGGNRPIPAHTTETLAAGVIGMCAVISALFAWMAQRRKARAEGRWKDDGR